MNTVKFQFIVTFIFWINTLIIFVVCLENEQLQQKVTTPSITVSTSDIETVTSADQLSKYSSDVLPKLYPHIITIERLETLLRQASKIFQPNEPTMSVTSTATSAFVDQNPYEPTELNQQMQPPSNEPYNFYLPQYEHDIDLHSKPHLTKFDRISRKLEKIVPPPLLLQKSNSINSYYNFKTKKIPKKYDGTLKNINYKLSKVALKPIETLRVENKISQKANSDTIDYITDTNSLKHTKNLRQQNPCQKMDKCELNHNNQNTAQIPTITPSSLLANDQQEFYFMRANLENNPHHHLNYDDSFFAIDISVPPQNNNRMESANRLHNISQNSNLDDINELNNNEMRRFEVLENEDDLMAASSIIHQETPKFKIQFTTK